MGGQKESRPWGPPVFVHVFLLPILGLLKVICYFWAVLFGTFWILLGIMFVFFLGFLSKSKLPMFFSLAPCLTHEHRTFKRKKTREHVRLLGVVGCVFLASPFCWKDYFKVRKPRRSK